MEIHVERGDPLQVRCWFEIQSPTVDPRSITDVLGIEPTSSWRVGEPMPRSDRTYKTSRWRFKPCCTRLVRKATNRVSEAIILAILPIFRRAEVDGFTIYYGQENIHEQEVATVKASLRRIGDTIMAWCGASAVYAAYRQFDSDV
jgi:Domain of unknown function (DUF4279)